MDIVLVTRVEVDLNAGGVRDGDVLLGPHGVPHPPELADVVQRHVLRLDLPLAVDAGDGKRLILRLAGRLWSRRGEGEFGGGRTGVDAGVVIAESSESAQPKKCDGCDRNGAARQ